MVSKQVVEVRGPAAWTNPVIRRLRARGFDAFQYAACPLKHPWAGGLDFHCKVSPRWVQWVCDHDYGGGTFCNDGYEDLRGPELRGFLRPGFVRRANYSSEGPLIVAVDAMPESMVGDLEKALPSFTRGQLDGGLRRAVAHGFLERKFFRVLPSGKGFGYTVSPWGKVFLSWWRREHSKGGGESV